MAKFSIYEHNFFKVCSQSMLSCQPLCSNGLHHRQRCEILQRYKFDEEIQTTLNFAKIWVLVGYEEQFFHLILKMYQTSHQFPFPKHQICPNQPSILFSEIPDLLKYGSEPRTQNNRTTRGTENRLRSHGANDDETSNYSSSRRWRSAVVVV